MRKPRITIPWLGRVRTRPQRVHRRHYPRISKSPLPDQRNVHPVTADQTLFETLGKLRGASRMAMRSDSFFANGVRALVENVVGASGFKLRLPEVEKAVEQEVTKAFGAWGMACDVPGELTWQEFETLALRQMAVDGEFLIRLRFDGDWGLRLQMLDPERLDRHLVRGNIVMGVEKDADGRPIAYHLTNNSTRVGFGSGGYSVATGHDRVPADEIVHGFLREFPGQTRGAPWGASSLLLWPMLDSYAQSEVRAAEASARAYGFVTSTNEDLNAGALADAADEDGDAEVTISPGEILHLEPGEQFTSWDPKHPVGSFDSFTRSLAKRGAAGMGVPYHELTGDLQGVNFSAGRIGNLATRERWRLLQRRLSEQLHQPIYAAWLPRAAVSGFMELPAGVTPDALRMPRWVGRGWSEVQPREEAAAREIGINNGTISRTEIAEMRGREVADVLGELAEERRLMAELGLTPDGGQVAPRVHSVPTVLRPVSWGPPTDDEGETT